RKYIELQLGHLLNKRPRKLFVLGAYFASRIIFPQGRNIWQLSRPPVARTKAGQRSIVGWRSFCGSAFPADQTGARTRSRGRRLW
ncbi:unnamed protein product, partial [Amoebophrya sp. A120]